MRDVLAQADLSDTDLDELVADQAGRGAYLTAWSERRRAIEEAEHVRIEKRRAAVDAFLVSKYEPRVKRAQARLYHRHYEYAMARALRTDSKRKDARRRKRRRLQDYGDGPKPGSSVPVAVGDAGLTPAPAPICSSRQGKEQSRQKPSQDAPPTGKKRKDGRARRTVVSNSSSSKTPSGPKTSQEELPPKPDIETEQRLQQILQDERYNDRLLALVWREISRKEIPRAHRIMQQSITNRIINQKKTSQLASKEAKRWQIRTNKTIKDMQTKAKRGMREMLVFWKRNERDERDQRKRAEKEAVEQARREEEQREVRRQARKLNFLITQTELYSHFIGKKINTEAAEMSSDVQSSGIAQLNSNNLSSPFTTVAFNNEAAKPDKVDFDADDDQSLHSAAAHNAQKAVDLAKKRAKTFDDAGKHRDGVDSEISQLKNVDIDGEDMNFTNPSSFGETELPQPKMLACQLKEYQLKGFNWLVNLYEQGINGILADEMGLGKTVQSISVMAHLAESHNIWGPYLVIAPASTLHNWQQELTKFVPQMKALPYWGGANDRKILRKFWNRKSLVYNESAPFHVLITSYQIVVRDEKYFQRMKWQYMILDEAQAIKSSSSNRWKSLLGFQCRNRLLLTGTPIQNSMQELWALLHFIMPTLFDSHEEFSDWFSKDIENHAQSNSNLNDEQLKRLHMILKPFMLRRVKKNVQSELDDKIEKEIFCPLSYRQRALYQRVKSVISKAELLAKATSREGLDSIMNLVMQFRKVCNHPDLFERADVRSPLFLGTFAETGSIMRESSLSLAYTSRSFISFRIPKLIYRGGGLLAVPHKYSKAGFERKYLGGLLNIWTPHHLNQSQNDCSQSAFPWLRFVKLSISEVSSAFHQTSVQQVYYQLSKNFKHHRTGYFEPDRPCLVMEDKSLTSTFLGKLCTVANEVYVREKINRMEPCYLVKASAPPIEFDCSDRGFTLDIADMLFDNSIRCLLYGSTDPFENKKVAEHQKVSTDVQPGLLPLPSLESLGYSPIAIPAMSRFVSDSGKLATLDRLLDELKTGSHRVLLYFQMTRMIDLMEEFLGYRQYKYLRLDGSTKISDRRDMVMEWQTQPDIFIFLLSTRAGGLGINLTAADTVIFYDSDWNPSVDAQATDRAHRLGQMKQVTVYRLVTRNTIEEQILKRAKEKEEVQKVVISGGDYKQQQSVDFAHKAGDVVSWLLDDDELSQIQRQQIDSAAVLAVAGGANNNGAGGNGIPNKKGGTKRKGF